MSEKKLVVNEVQPPRLKLGGDDDQNFIKSGEPNKPLLDINFKSTHSKITTPEQSLLFRKKLQELVKKAIIPESLTINGASPNIESPAIIFFSGLNPDGEYVRVGLLMDKNHIFYRERMKLRRIIEVIEHAANQGWTMGMVRYSTLDGGVDLKSPVISIALEGKNNLKDLVNILLAFAHNPLEVTVRIQMPFGTGWIDMGQFNKERLTTQMEKFLPWADRFNVDSNPKYEYAFPSKILIKNSNEGIGILFFPGQAEYGANPYRWRLIRVGEDPPIPD